MTFTSSSRSGLLALAGVALALTACGFDHSIPTGGSTAAPPSPTPSSAEVENVDLAGILSIPPDVLLDELGTTHLRFRAYVSQMVGVGTCPISIAPGEGWLNPCGGPQRVLVVAPARDEGLTALVPPGMDIAQIPVDSWVEVIGHFDDPAALECGVQGANGPTPDEDAVDLCRNVFVIDRVSSEG